MQQNDIESARKLLEDAGYTIYPPDPKLEPVLDLLGNVKQSMIQLPKFNGRSFKCKCGGNVFHQPDKTRPNIYECNSCGTWYESK